MSAMTALGVAAEPQAHGQSYLVGLLRDYRRNGVIRRREVAALILTHNGLTTAEICDLLSVSRRTLKRDLVRVGYGLRARHGRPLPAAG